MPCCLLCFDGGPVEGDQKAFRSNSFQISMMDTLTQNQPVCCLTYLLPCCSAYYTRYRVLDKDLTKYSCCQGYLDGVCCFRSKYFGEQRCPEFSLCCESFLCLGPSMSSSRMFIMDHYDLRPDPCDNRVVRLTNCLMLLSCVFNILAIFIRELRHAAHLLRYIADFVFYSTIGCMASQVLNEIDYRQSATYSSDFSQDLSMGGNVTVGKPLLDEVEIKF